MLLYVYLTSRSRSLCLLKHYLPDSPRLLDQRRDQWLAQRHSGQWTQWTHRWHDMVLVRRHQATCGLTRNPTFATVGPTMVQSSATGASTGPTDVGSTPPSDGLSVDPTLARQRCATCIWALIQYANTTFNPVQKSTEGLPSTPPCRGC